MLSIESGGSARKPSNVAPAAPFYLAVDRQFKSGYDSFEKAETAALAIKRQYPRLLVSVYETSLRRHIAIEVPQADGKREALAERKAITRYAASATTH